MHSWVPTELSQNFKTTFTQNARAQIHQRKHSLVPEKKSQDVEVGTFEWLNLSKNPPFTQTEAKNCYQGNHDIWIYVL